jgi:transcriptional regulator with XRE-family HTH domain
MARRANGAAIASLREALGISQRSLAARIGIRPSALCKIERSANGAGTETIKRIATELGVPLDAITYPVPEPEPVP